MNVGYDGAGGLGGLLGVGGSRTGRSDDPGSVLDISHSLFFVFVVRGLDRRERVGRMRNRERQMTKRQRELFCCQGRVRVKCGEGQ